MTRCSCGASVQMKWHTNWSLQLTRPLKTKVIKLTLDQFVFVNILLCKTATTKPVTKTSLAITFLEERGVPFYLFYPLHQEGQSERFLKEGEWNHLHDKGIAELSFCSSFNLTSLVSANLRWVCFKNRTLIWRVKYPSVHLTSLLCSLWGRWRWQLFVFFIYLFSYKKSKRLAVLCGLWTACSIEQVKRLRQR